MTSKNPNIVDTLTSYYVNNPITRVASPRFLPQNDKENQAIIRNLTTTREDLNSSQAKITMVANLPTASIIGGQPVATRFNYQSPRIFVDKPTSLETRTYSTKTMHVNNFVFPSQLVQENRLQRLKTQNYSRKKSVRFIEEAQELTKQTRAQSIKPETTRKRSSSILKSRSQSRDSQSYSVTKTKQYRFPGSMKSLSEYKNNALKEKYNQIVRTLRQNNEFTERQTRIKTYYSINASITQRAEQPAAKQVATMGKYTDSLFPPISTSLFKTNPNQSQRFRWKRISQIYGNRKLKINNKGQKSRILISRQSSVGDYLVTVMNSMKDSPQLLDLFFEESEYNDHGIYLIKIFQDNEWRYVIIDDFIPVREIVHKDTITYVPAFVDVKMMDDRDRNHSLEIWPLILEKAYASYLGSYGALLQGSVLSFMTEMMGLPMQSFQISQLKEQALKESLEMLNKNQSLIMLGYSKSSSFVPIFRYPTSDFTTFSGLQIQQASTSSTQKRRRILRSQLAQKFDSIKLVNLQHLKYLNAVQVGSVSNIGKRIKSKKVFNDQLAIEHTAEIQKDRMICKSFILFGKDDVSIILKKKGNNKHWLRAILLLKQLDSYRWIDGQYSNTCISMTASLAAGTYFLLLMPEWSIDQSQQISILLYSRANQPELATVSDPEQHILEKGCCDLAQRVGRLIQINKWICTYTKIDENAGIIIENINNQRRNGNIRIFRSIKNLKPKSCLLFPYNREFYHPTTGRPKNEAEIVIEKQQNYSVVLMFHGGVDSAFMKSFSFGP